jgi:hypothetical protein
MTLDELASASVLYGLGFSILFGLFALMYLHAYRRRADLGLNELEAFDARKVVGHHLVSAGVGMFAMLFALIGPRELAFLSPSSFALMGPGHWGYGTWIEKRRKVLEARASAVPAAVT